MFNLRKVTQVLIVSLCMGLSLSACEGSCLKKSKEVQALLWSQLKVGDARTKIESVLNSAGIQYSYDEYSNRYQSNITDQCGSFESVIAYVYLDSASRMSRIEVFVSYTAP